MTGVEVAAGAAAIYGAYDQNKSRMDAKKAATAQERARQNASIEARKLKEAEDKKLRGQAATRARRSLSAATQTDNAGSLGLPLVPKQSVSSLLGL